MALSHRHSRVVYVVWTPLFFKEVYLNYAVYELSKTVPTSPLWSLDIEYHTPSSTTECNTTERNTKSHEGYNQDDDQHNEWDGHHLVVH